MKDIKIKGYFKGDVSCETSNKNKGIGGDIMNNNDGINYDLIAANSRIRYLEEQLSKALVKIKMLKNKK